MRLFRICKERFSETAMSGEGARLYSGRWNEAGVPMVYCATSRALAALEFFVHLDPSMVPDDLVMTEIDVPDDVAAEVIDLQALASAWKTQDSSTAQLGTAWARSGRSVLLRVPSVVVEGDWNVLLNPAHRDFARIQVSGQQPFRFDERMFC